MSKHILYILIGAIALGLTMVLVMTNVLLWLLTVFMFVGVSYWVGFMIVDLIKTWKQKQD